MSMVTCKVSLMSRVMDKDVKSYSFYCRGVSYGVVLGAFRLKGLRTFEVARLVLTLQFRMAVRAFHCNTNKCRANYTKHPKDHDI